MRSLKHLLALPMATVILVACPTILSTLAQESNAESSKGLDQKALTLKEQIDALLKDGNPKAARNALHEALNAKSLAVKTESDRIRLNNLHSAIAFGFYHNQEYGEAVDELVTSFDGILGCPDTLRKAYMLFSVAELMNLLGAQSGKDSKSLGSRSMTITNGTRTKVEPNGPRKNWIPKWSVEQLRNSSSPRKFSTLPFLRPRTAVYGRNTA